MYLSEWFLNDSLWHLFGLDILWVLTGDSDFLLVLFKPLSKFQSLWRKIEHFTTVVYCYYALIPTPIDVCAESLILMKTYIQQLSPAFSWRWSEHTDRNIGSLTTAAQKRLDWNLHPLDEYTSAKALPSKPLANSLDSLTDKY